MPGYRKFLSLLTLLVFSTTISWADENATPVSWEQIEALPKPAVDHLIKYGPDQYQFGELRLPGGKGPHPVVVFVHGGCWLAEFDLTMAANLSGELAKAGIASWTIEYRRIGNEGGAWPGTMHDMSAAVEHLRQLEKPYNLDLSKIVLMGHSAGGHLVLWYAAKKNLDKSSEFYSETALDIKGVVPLAAISNITTYRHEYDTQDCNTAVPGLLGGEPEDLPERVSQLNPAQLLPLQVPVRLVHGDADVLVPLRQSTAFMQAARKAGDDITLTVVDQAGHFDVIAPFSVAWQMIMSEIRALLEMK